jgi:hypothetical protein
MNSGILPASLIGELRGKYPWLSLREVAADLGYHEVKMEGVAAASGEIIVFCDADCRYSEQWLSSLLEAFTSNPDVQVVGGCSSIEVTGPVSLATLLTWSFPPFPHGLALFRTASYLLNNVAFRRELLDDCPLPTGLSLYRGGCAIHCAELTERGVSIWRQPSARAIHPPIASSFQLLVLRWLLHGRDMRLWNRRRAGRPESSGLARVVGSDLLTLCELISEGTWKPLRRLPLALADEPRRIVWLPLAACIIALSLLGTLTGFALSYICPDWLLEHATRRLGVPGMTTPS